LIGSTEGGKGRRKGELGGGGKIIVGGHLGIIKKGVGSKFSGLSWGKVVNIIVVVRESHGIGRVARVQEAKVDEGINVEMASGRACSIGGIGGMGACRERGGRVGGGSGLGGKDTSGAGWVWVGGV
jgi:hypothetical protein